jgi:hypothetical protein
MSLFRQDLPSYTSERYFLLSEIEENCAIMSLDSAATSTTLAAIDSSVDVCFLYTVWSLADGQNVLIQTLSHIHSQTVSIAPVLVIETYSSQPNDDDTPIQLEEALKTIHKTFPPWNKVNILFSVSNDVNACPGLEFIYDCAVDYIKTDQSTLRVITEDPSILLGSLNHEPDAINGVVQYLLSNEIDPLNSIAARYNLTVRQSSSPTTSNKPSSKNSLLLYILLAVFIAYIAAKFLGN